MLALLAALALSLPTQGTPGAVLYCSDGIYTMPGPLPLKAFRKGPRLTLVLPYRRPDWQLGVRYRFVHGKIVREVLKRPRPFPEVRLALIRVCVHDGKGWHCTERAKRDWNTHWDPGARVLWLFVEEERRVRGLEVRLVFGEGECGGYLLYRQEELKL